MTTLVIHAPYSQVKQKQKQSFSQTVATGRGYGYAISGGLFRQLSPGDDVIVICNAHRKQAAGKIKELIPTVKAANGLQCYDIVMTDVEPVPYSLGKVKLSSQGVAVISSPPERQQ